MWQCEILDLHQSRVMGCMGNRPHEEWGTWAMGHISTRGRVIGHMGDGAHGQLDT